MKRVLLIFLIILVIIAMIGSIAYVVMLPGNEETLTSPLQPSATPVKATPTIPLLVRDKQEITQVTDAFYLAYSNCLKEPPVEARGRVSTYCQSNTNQTSVDFVENLRLGGTARSGGDPIMCSQNPQTNATVESVDFESPERAVATVALQSGGFAQKVPVVLIKESRVWKIDMITCPR